MRLLIKDKDIHASSTEGAQFHLNKLKPKEQKEEPAKRKKSYFF